MKGFRLLLLLFVAFRVSMLAFWPAGDLARWSDYDYFYEIAGWVDEGRLPYLDYWVEYPPLFPFLSVLLYLATPHYEAYAAALALVQVCCEAGALVLFYRLGRRALGEAGAEQAAWTYALLFAPLAALWLSFDALTTFFLLLALERWVAGRRVQSALAVGVGGLVKWFPLLFVAVAVRYRRSWWEALGYVALALGVVALALGGLYALGPTHTLASLRSLGARGSWQTVWALLDGNLGTGAYHASRLDPAAAALAQGNPAVVPVWLATLLFGGLYGWLWWRAEGTGDARQAVRLTALTLVVFFLWSRGWSPQWLAMLAPLLLLVLPRERAALILVALTFTALAEWPVMLSRGANEWLYLTVPLRTALLALLLASLGSPQGRGGEKNQRKDAEMQGRREKP